MAGAASVDEADVTTQAGAAEPVEDEGRVQARDALPDTKSQRESPSPSLPPAMAAMHGKSAAEILAELNKTPLFMTSLETNDELEAFQALAYEGTPAEVGLNFKERGNECFTEGKWSDAKEFYTKGIQVLQAEQKRRAQTAAPRDTNADDDAGTQDELSILEACLVNRAACHLSLRNYRSCTLDCASVLRLNPTNVKAHYRSARALLELVKIPEAHDICARGLALDPTNAALRVTAQAIATHAAAIEAQQQRVRAVLLQHQRETQLRRAALQARGIRTRATPQPPDLEDARIQLVPDPSDPRSELVFPTLLLYPLHLQSDFIKAFPETETLGARLAAVLADPPPWDTQGEYTPRAVECYMETVTGGLVKVGKNASLLQALGTADGSGAAKVEVVDEVVRIFVVPKARATAWIQDFKTKRAAQRGQGR